ncbi:MAG: hypothetical protein WBM07_03625, partial [Chitinivibrionales bacterium]
MVNRPSSLSIIMLMCLCFTGERIYAAMETDFANPPLHYRGDVFAVGVNTILKQDGAGGIGLMGDCSNWNTSGFYATVNAQCDSIQKLGLDASFGIYDDDQFPSGNGGHGNANHGG